MHKNESCFWSFRPLLVRSGLTRANFVFRQMLTLDILSPAYAVDSRQENSQSGGYIKHNNL